MKKRAHHVFHSLVIGAATLTTYLALVLTPSPAIAQPGWVLSHQKISDTEGGFTGELDDWDGFGQSVAWMGDLDGDGVGDLVVGANQDSDGGARRGAVWVLFLNNDGTVKTHQKISNTEGGFNGELDDHDMFGLSLASLGDLDGDGAGDLAVGAPGDDDGADARGAIWILFLNADGTVKSHQKISDTEGGFNGGLRRRSLFGGSIASLGDFDGDGVGDVAVGADWDDDGGPFTGAVWILFLNADGTVKAHQKISDTEGGFNGVLDDDDCFGKGLASLGDLDGDGVGDLAVGARLDDDGGMDQGAVWILFLNADGTVKSHQKISAVLGGFTGDLDPGDYFGWGIASLPDLDEDGVGDIVVGAPFDDDGSLDLGAVWILFLNSDGTVKSHQKISDTEGGFTGALDYRVWFGRSVASLDDLDGNGVADLAVGAPWDNDGGAGHGAVWRLFLDGPLSRPTLTALGGCPGPMQFQVDGATHGGHVAYVYAFGEGELIIPPGNPCAGTQLGLNATVQLAGVERADENGVARFDVAHVPSDACGRIHVQSIDLTTCATTNVVSLH